MIRALTVIALLAVLTACGGHPKSAGATADEIASCKAAVAARFDALASTGVVPPTSRPDECTPLSDAQLAAVGKELAG
jgi:hypothetical protein